MAEKFYQNEKFQKVFYPVLYIILAISFVVSGLVIFHNTYYTPIYVHGSSMKPTLLGGYTTDRVHYGIADNHAKTIDGLRRFDVAITYYPSSWLIVPGEEDTTYKIKRVWGFPGETITLTHTETEYSFTVMRNDRIIESVTGQISTKQFDLDGVTNELTVATFAYGNRVFNTNISGAGGRVFTVTLSEEKQEYFLMGDNWQGSSDSYTHLGSKDRITRSLLQGKVVCIQGTAVVADGKLTKKKRIKDLYYF